ncbi:MAG: GH1 [uncultured Chloroflexi bacterium]|uniref:dTDP-4-dehydrorhamnose reductase n=1 Tax=uncultured Chloroflexota bacterium TaxID=166587 RepID=A0A6J4JH64_9CHLR|nr:MAG: GH1 [uncultured Chloroflexota bacterium]
MWGGLEATVNRVDDRYLDQLERSGHASRPGDLDLIASLGIRALRYPVLWERVAPNGTSTPSDPAGVAGADWSWTDERLGRLHELGITPIAGLVHHGSGPRHTDLLQPDFPLKLAAYARAVAERYPWVDAYTPVNEPLTTSRFAALYGHWYPHTKDALSWARALLNECKATVLAMRAIREVNPRARLVQTEDMGKTHSTRRLRYQAAFENERRWLTFDLLAGLVHPERPLHAPGEWMGKYLTWLGISIDELAWFQENPCPPDVLGINHYLTSERFLDERPDLYPLHTHGGNGRHRYADVEAVRVRAQGIEGPGALLLETWERYRLPVAVTEAHLFSTREEQLRWLLEVWRGAEAARNAGADVRAMTVWSLLGAYDWNSLVTRDNGYYEPGVFDLRAPEPRPTALAGLMNDLAAGKQPRHPVLTEPGWWRRPRARLVYPPVRSAQPRGPLALRQRRFSMRYGERTMRAAQPVLITGRTGTLGQAFARLCDLRAIVHRVTSRAEMDIGDPASVAAALDALRPWAVVNTAGYVRVDDAEQDRDRCFRENADGPAILAEACAARGIKLLTFSSDLVFDGRKGEPYVESDAPAPLNVYGESKAAAEQRVLAACPDALVARTSAFFGAWDEHNFVTAALRELAAGQRFVAAVDQVVSATYVPDLVHACLDLLLDGERGILHLANGGALSWYDLALQAAQMAGINAERLQGATTDTLGLPAKRPANSALSSERASLLPSIDVALARYLHDLRVSGADWLLPPPAEQRERDVA